MPQNPDGIAEASPGLSGGNSASKNNYLIRLVEPMLAGWALDATIPASTSGQILRECKANCKTPCLPAPPLHLLEVAEVLQSMRLTVSRLPVTASAEQCMVKNQNDNRSNNGD